jgi:hypothetical protein
MRKVTPTAMIKVLESKRQRCLHMHHGSKRGLKQTPLERERTPSGEGRQRQQIAPLQVWLDY